MRNIFSDLYVACLKLKVQTDILTLRQHGTDLTNKKSYYENIFIFYSIIDYFSDFITNFWEDTTCREIGDDEYSSNRNNARKQI